MIDSYTYRGSRFAEHLSFFLKTTDIIYQKKKSHPIVHCGKKLTQQPINT